LLKEIHHKMKILGTNIYYEYYHHPQQTDTIVLIHGFLSSTFSYRKLIPLLKKHFSIIAIDLPPFGKSEKATKFFYSYHNMAKAVIELLERLQIKQAVIVGHSMGGQISLYAAKQKPDLFKKIVLICSSGYMQKMPSSLIFCSYLPYFYLYVKRQFIRQGVWKSLCSVVHDQSLINEDMIYGYSEPFYDDKIFRALTRMIREREGDLSSQDLKAIEIPCLLVWGEEDKIVPIEVGYQLQKDLPISRFVSFKQTGHLVPEERPYHVSNHIFDFCFG